MVLATSTGGIIVISIAIFFVVIILLVALLVFAGKKLLPQGKVKITINDEKDLEVDPGGGVTHNTVKRRDISTFCLWWWRHLCHVQMSGTRWWWINITNRSRLFYKKRAVEPLEACLSGKGKRGLENPC